MEERRQWHGQGQIEPEDLYGQGDYTLTGICLEHLHSFARSRHIGFIARADEAAGNQTDQWLFTLSDLMVVAILYSRCQH